MIKTGKLRLTLKKEQIKRAAEKYHFSEKDRKELEKWAVYMEKVMEQGASWWIWEEEAGKERIPKKWQESSEGLENRQVLAAVITLGKGVDELQEECHAKEDYSGSYQVECLAGEYLLEAYELFQHICENEYGRQVKQFLFCGTKNFPLEDMKKALAFFEKEKIPVTCNDYSVLSPRKSVVFLAVLGKDKEDKCGHICDSCQLANCPNRVKKEEKKPLPYGYERILGKRGNEIYKRGS